MRWQHELELKYPNIELQPYYMTDQVLLRYKTGWLWSQWQILGSLDFWEKHVVSLEVAERVVQRFVGLPEEDKLVMASQEDSFRSGVKLGQLFIKFINIGPEASDIDALDLGQKICRWDRTDSTVDVYECGKGFASVYTVERDRLYPRRALRAPQEDYVPPDDYPKR